MPTEGETLKKFIDNQGVNKTTLARDMQMSKQNLYQFYKSQYLNEVTKKKFEDYFGEKIFGLEATASDKSVRQPKIATDPEKEGITFIDIAAQAGYAHKRLEPTFNKKLEKIYIPGMPY